MMVKSSVVQKEKSAFSGYFIPFIPILIFVIIILSVTNSIPGNDFSKDTLVGDFRTDVNMLAEAAKMIEAKRAGNPHSNLHEFGTTGKVLKPDEISQGLRRVLVKTARFENESFEEAVRTMEIMGLDEGIYAKELKSGQFYNLSCDNNLKHYVVVTKGKFAGTILYNGDRQFIDSNKKSYFGTGIFEQL